MIKNQTNQWLKLMYQWFKDDDSMININESKTEIN